MELVEIGMGLVFLLLGIAAVLGLVVYLTFGLFHGLALTWDFGKAVLRRDWPGYWGLALGGGWFLLIAGLDLQASPDTAPAPWGALMVLLSFGAWLGAGVLQRRERTASLPSSRRPRRSP